MTPLPFSQEELSSMNPQRVFGGDASQAAFLLGGIGTGNVSLGSGGQLQDWEIFNAPGKGNHLPYTFFSIWAQCGQGEPIARVLEAQIPPPYAKSHGFGSHEVAGLPRLEQSQMRGEYPFVWVDFGDTDLPVQVQLEAFTPFIPLCARDSGIPGAILRYRVRNPQEEEVKVSIAGSLANAVGFTGYNLFGKAQVVTGVSNTFREDETMRGLYYTSELAPDHLQFGNMALVTTDQSVTVKPTWRETGWFDGLQEYWNDFSNDGRLSREPDMTGVGSELVRRENRTQPRIGSLGILHVLAPGEERVFEFLLTWYFPNRPKMWDGHIFQATSEELSERNYYGTLFDDAWDVGRYLVREQDRLEHHSREFHRALFSSTLPDYVIDALASNITVLRSTTCFRIGDGTFLGWEGCHDQKGCCEGSCTHVWNYAQTVAFLFPELERSMRLVEFNLETDEDGKMAFRTQQVFGRERWDMLPATDGQMGTIVRLYRDWRLSGDDDLLRTVWHKASKALDFAFDYWDADGDYVLDSQQHNTYDIEFYGPNSLSNSLFFAALKAGAAMAEYLGDREHAAKYQEALRVGSARMDALLWGGEYYTQKIDDVNQYCYQYGDGCLADQVFGQMLAHVAGLGYVLPAKRVAESLLAIFRHNFRTSLARHHSVQRTYALNDEKGLLLCSWPNGGRPRFPFPYADEVWTGIEYQVAAHLIFEGLVDEGLTIVKAVRDRHDGYRRNPWNEVECGHHYARAMASWALLPALSGFQCDLVKGTMEFAPRINQDAFSTFWSNGRAWGIYEQRRDGDTGELKRKVEVLYGDLSGVTTAGC